MLSTVNIKYEYIDLIDLLVGISTHEKEQLSKLTLKEIEYKYHLVLKEKSEEML